MKFFKFLNLEEKTNWRLILVYILIAYVFNIWVRFVYIDMIQQFPQWQHNGTYIINNPDGLFYAEGARDYLNGFHQKNDLSPIDNITSIFTALVSKFLNIPLDKVIFYIPGVVGSLLVIPVILIGEVLGSSFVGFLAGLMSAMTWSYYHRTMFGYYDTDMLTVVLPTFAIWAILWSLKNKNIKYFFVAPLIEIFMISWHGGLYNIANGLFIMSFVYLLYLKFVKKEKIFLQSLFLLFLITPLLQVEVKFKLLILFLLEVWFFYFKNEIETKFQKVEKFFYLIVLGVYIVVIGIPWIENVLNNAYFTRSVTETDEGFKYYSVINTVSETSHINFDVMVHRISGSYLAFFAGAIGLVLLFLKYPQIIIFAPMIVLGLYAERGGLRFTIFAVPFFALGDAYIVYLIAKLSKKIFNEKVADYAKYLSAVLLMSIFIYPNYRHIHQYLTPAVVNKQEIKILQYLKQVAKRDDYVLSWWDYGYPIRYYVDVKTLVDGGKHDGYENFPVSFALTRPQLPSYNSAILDVYFTEKHFIDHKQFDFIKDIEKLYNKKITSLNELEQLLSKKIPLPKIKEDIYYYLPYRMINIFPTVALFSSLDIKTGKTLSHFFYKTSDIKRSNNEILIAGMAKIVLSKGVIVINNNLIPIKSFDIVAYNKQGQLIKKELKLSKQGLRIIFMKSYGTILILDDFYYNSAYIQMFVLDNYDKNLFKPVVLTPFVKVYKVIKK